MFNIKFYRICLNIIYIEIEKYLILIQKENILPKLQNKACFISHTVGDPNKIEVALSIVRSIQYRYFVGKTKVWLSPWF